MRLFDWIDKDHGIEKYYNPFLNQHGFYCRDRQVNVFLEMSPHPITPTPNNQQESYCAFCLGNSSEATPEKVRAVKIHDQISYSDYPSLHSYEEEVLFRRQGNLFEILNFDYWKEKYQVAPSQESLERIEQAFDNLEMREYLESLLLLKLKRTGQDISGLSIKEKKILCEPFYAGFHELLTSGRHYLPGAQDDSRIFHSGNISYQVHRVSYEMTIKSMADMVNCNPHILFIAVFQNWLSSAGASFQHWHKHILGLDFWGDHLVQEALLVQSNPSLYRDFIFTVAQAEHLFLAENKHALAYIELGGKTGRIVICSKSHHLRPQEHTIEEIHSMSDLSHAILKTLPTSISYNEEWFYTPFHQDQFRTPWRIIIDLRITIKAGFENITKHNIHSVAPSALSSMIVERLQNQKKSTAPDIVLNPLIDSADILKYL